MSHYVKEKIVRAIGEPAVFYTPLSVPLQKPDCHGSDRRAKAYIAISDLYSIS